MMVLPYRDLVVTVAQQVLPDPLVPEYVTYLLLPRHSLHVDLGTLLIKSLLLTFIGPCWSHWPIW